MHIDFSVAVSHCLSLLKCPNVIGRQIEPLIVLALVFESHMLVFFVVQRTANGRDRLNLRDPVVHVTN